jgi:putative proteasome-type protease
MTYCVGIKLNDGLIFAGDTRTNAGVDHVATYRKLFTFSNGTSHSIVLMSSGNLATTQALVEHLNRMRHDEQDGLFAGQSLFDVATRVGKKLVAVIQEGAETCSTQGVNFTCNLILGGQVEGEEPRLFHIYPQGNFIEASVETPFLQIGEEKYGKPILDRIIKPETPIDRALICALLSLDSTMKSNMTVDMPLDVLVYHKNSMDLNHQRRIERDDEDFLAMRKYWGAGLRRIIDELAPFEI